MQAFLIFARFPLSLITVLNMYSNFLCPPAAHSCFAQSVASESAEWTRKFPFAFSGTAGFFFLTHTPAFSFGMSEHGSALHDCSECETVRFPDENPVHKYEWVWNYPQYTDLCFFCYSTQFWYMPWRRVIDFFFFQSDAHDFPYVSLHAAACKPERRSARKND